MSRAASNLQDMVLFWVSGIGHYWKAIEYENEDEDESNLDLYLTFAAAIFAAAIGMHKKAVIDQRI